MTSIALANFQTSIVGEIADEISKENPAACVLTAPTGSGKTLVMGKALEASAQIASTPTAWFWLAPFEVIVDQTAYTLRHEIGADIRPKDLAIERTLTGLQAGDVWLTTSAYISNGSSNLHREAELAPALVSMVGAMRDRGFRIGIVIDEAHIGADDASRMGSVCRDIGPDAVLAATATPKDGKLDRFLSALGHPRRRDFAVNRRDVVRELLNKEALRITRLVSNRERDTVAEETLLDLLVQRSWSRNTAISEALGRNKIDLTPLMLVQVDNGENEADEMKARIKKICDLRDDEIAIHLDGKKSHGKLTEVANDPSVKVLIFKLAAGTGFDAPRAFVLASARTVDDKDHALQFIGRIMRVQREVREVLRGADISPEDRKTLNTGRLVVLDDASQAGFRDAATLIKRLKTEVDPEAQDVEVEDVHIHVEDDEPGSKSAEPAYTVTGSTAPTVQNQDSDPFEAESETPTSNAEDAQVDTIVTQPVTTQTAAPKKLGPTKDLYSDRDDLAADLAEQGLEFYERIKPLEGLSECLRREQWPDLPGMDELVTSVSAARQPQPNDVFNLIGEALGEKTLQVLDNALLGEGTVEKEKVTITDRARAAVRAEDLFAQTARKLMTLSEPGHRRKFLARMRKQIVQIAGDRLEKEQDALTLARLFVSRYEQDFVRAETRALARHAVVANAEPLPDLLLSPVGLGRTSGSNAFSFIPPSSAELDQADPDARRALRLWDGKSIDLADGTTIKVASIDKTWTVNDTEDRFIEVLERQPDVRWWLRNPVRKPYAVSVLKVDGKRELFYPDFVIGSSWDEDLRQQLAETKYDEGDIRAKLARGATVEYGHVIFVAIKDGKLRLVNQDGSFGEVLTTETAHLLSASIGTAIAP